MSNISHRELLEQAKEALQGLLEYSGLIEERDCDVKTRKGRKALALIEAELAKPQEPLTDTYVQRVPDKCDRIIWKGNYLHLPELSEKPVSGAVGELTAFDQWVTKQYQWLKEHPENAENKLQKLIAWEAWEHRAALSAQPAVQSKGDPEGAFARWMQKRGPLGTGAVPERIFFAGYAAGVCHANNASAQPEHKGE